MSGASPREKKNHQEQKSVAVHCCLLLINKPKLYRFHCPVLKTHLKFRSNESIIFLKKIRKCGFSAKLEEIPQNRSNLDLEFAHSKCEAANCLPETNAACSPQLPGATLSPSHRLYPDMSQTGGVSPTPPHTPPVLFEKHQISSLGKAKHPPSPGWPLGVTFYVFCYPPRRPHED